ncbi:N-acetylneuraminate synthase family protein [Pelagibacteraceae bacterium]|nr:N-acetylneuraminate synthase family protein [Pelagibacteraceae bacterium]
MKKNTYIIAEVAQAHDGSLGSAYAYIDAISKTGVDAIKFQTHFAEEESTYDEPWRVKFSKQDKSRFDYWKRIEFTEKNWIDLKKYADKKNIDFISSPFSIKAANLLKKIRIKYWKIASGEIHNDDLINFCCEDNKPMLISTGLVNDNELVKIYKKLKKIKKEFAFFHCVSMYPTTPKYWNLNNIIKLKEKFDCKIGFSDHSGDIYSSISAATIGIDFLEVHVTFNKKSFGPDNLASLDINQLEILVRGIRQIDDSKNYNLFNNLKTKNKKIFSRSLALKKPMSKGTILKKDDLILKKPGSGIQKTEIKKVVGKRLKVNKSHLRLLKKIDLE